MECLYQIQLDEAIQSSPAIGEGVQTRDMHTDLDSHRMEQCWNECIRFLRGHHVLDCGRDHVVRGEK